MKSKKIVFSAPFKVELWNDEVELSNLAENAIALKTHYTLISPGTDMACLAGIESWFKLPNTPGYTAVGEVVATGSKVTNFAKGDLVYQFGGSNKEYQIVSSSELLIKLPKGIKENLVPFARMASIALTALRVGPVELGDLVAVTGLGLVGNFAVQLAKNAGAKVIAIDISEKRRELALKSGADYAFNPAAGNVKDKVMEISGGLGVNTVIESSGMSQVIAESLPLITPYGDMVLLGSPRAEYTTNITPLYRQSHDGNCINIKGASEWRVPVKYEKFVKHSIERNSKIVLDLIASEKLNVEALLTHTFKPEDAAKAYEGVRTDKENYLGVVFDWN